MDNDPNVYLDGLSLGSVTGIVVATMFIIEVLKRLCKEIGAFNKIPVFVYAIVISLGLSFLANRVFKINGEYMLKGDTLGVMWQSLIQALAASGFYTWLRSPANIHDVKKLGDPKVSKIIVPLLAIFMLVGCQNPEKALIREGMDQATRTIRAEHKEWTNLLAADPITQDDRREELPKLTPEQVKVRLDAHREYEELVSEDRK